MRLKQLTYALLLCMMPTFYAFADGNDIPPNNKSEENSAALNYCLPNATTPWENFITGVVFQDIFNTNQANEKSGNGTPQGLGDYTNLSTDILTGSTYTFNMDAEIQYFNSTPVDVYWRVWIDYNGDEDFNDAGELAVDRTEQASSPGINYNWQSSITVPATATPGTVRMRVVVYRDASPVGPCHNYGIIGEFEDYTVVIVDGNDTTAPTPTLTTASTNVTETFQVGVNFDEDITGLSNIDFNLSNGVVSNLQGSGSSYTIDVTPINAGNVSINLMANTVEDLAGNLNVSSNTLNITYTPPVNANYCDPGPTFPFDNYITELTFNNIVNTNQADPKSAATNPTGVSDYTNLSTIVVAGTPYDITVTGVMEWFTTGINGNGNLRVWIDFNQDGVFTDFNELVLDENMALIHPNATNDTYTFNNTIFIPASAVSGETRMRVLINQEDTAPGPCDANDPSGNDNLDGEYEDYTINILPWGSSVEASLDLVWKHYPANVLQQGSTRFRNPDQGSREYFRGCNVLAPGQDGWIEFELLDDVKNNGDQIYIGLIKTDEIIGDDALITGQYIFGVQGDAVGNPGENVSILESLTSVHGPLGGARRGDVFKIARENGTIFYSINGNPEYTSTVNANTFELEPVLYILKTGADHLVKVDFNVSGNFLCPEFELDGYYTKQEATHSRGGKVDFNIGGQTPPYIFTWSNPNLVGAVPVNVQAGNYTLTVTDAANLSKSVPVDVFKMYGVSWNSVEPGIDWSNNLYKKTTTNDITAFRLFSGHTISADADALIKLRLNEDILSGSSNEFEIYFKNTANSNDNYGMRFGSGGLTIMIDGTEYNANSSAAGIFNPDFRYNSEEYEYAIELKNRKITFFKNQKKLYTADILSSITDFSVALRLLNTENDGISMDIQLSEEPILSSVPITYFSLKPKLDGAYARTVQNKIHFKYTEHYPVADEPNSNLICKIYDWQRTELLNVSLNKEYGANYKTIDIPSNTFPASQYYILEVHNANKDKVYYLRFQKL